MSCIDFSNPMKPQEVAIDELSVIGFNQTFWFQRDVGLLVRELKFLKRVPQKS